MDDRRYKLADALAKEAEWLPKQSLFGSENPLDEYPDAIAYLRGEIELPDNWEENELLYAIAYLRGEIEHPDNWEENELLYAIVEDFNTLCSDYDI
jgi:hypothetical protein